MGLVLFAPCTLAYTYREIEIFMRMIARLTHPLPHRCLPFALCACASAEELTFDQAMTRHSFDLKISSMLAGMGDATSNITMVRRGGQ